MNIGIIGPGAMGTFLSGILGKEHHVDLLGRKKLDIDTIKVTGKTSMKTSVNYTTDPSELSEDDLLIICTKSFDTEGTMKTLDSYLSDDHKFLTLQNGLENEEIISKFVGKKRTIGGITSHGMTFKEPGMVKHAGEGETVIGSYPEGKDNRVKTIADELTDSGITTEVSENIIGHIWKKAVINSAINPITAIEDVRNGRLVEDEYLYRLMKDAANESLKVAEEHVNLPGNDIVEETKQVAERTSNNISSMLQDIRNKNRTEVEQINGAIVKKGKKQGVSAPVNNVLYNLVKGIENRYLRD